MCSALNAPLANSPRRLAALPLAIGAVRRGRRDRGPLGVKETTKWLNAHGHRSRKGATFSVGPVHGILTNRCYAYGKCLYGVRNAKTGELNDPDAVVEIDVPTIIPVDHFETVQSRLVRNNPRVTAPRVVNGPILLTGLAVCATCGAGMTRTGTRKGRRAYAYYNCAPSHQKGPSVCKGRHVPLGRLDELVLTNVKETLLVPERLASILEALMERRSRNDAAVADRRNALTNEIALKKDRLTRLYRAIEDAIVKLDQDLKARIQTLKGERDLAQATLDRITDHVAARTDITPERLQAFGALMREKLDAADVPGRKSYLRSVISRIEVDDHVVRIIGEKAVLADAIARREVPEGPVSGLVRKWRARSDSNARPSDS